jgi:hypothetical protein
MLDINTLLTLSEEELIQQSTMTEDLFKSITTKFNDAMVELQKKENHPANISVSDFFPHLVAKLDEAELRYIFLNGYFNMVGSLMGSVVGVNQG